MVCSSIEEENHRVRIRRIRIHVVILSSYVYLLSSIARAIYCYHGRCAFPLDTGTNQEIRYKLMTFGIPTDILPIDDDGTILLNNHKEWIEQRVELEKMDRTTNEQQITYISTPGPFDILLGRGKAAMKHPGNIRYKFLIEEHEDRYENTPKANKTLIAEEILQTLKGSDDHGRFLKLEKGRGWMEVDDVAAREKISMSFRDRRQQSRREQSKQPEPMVGVTMTLSSLFSQDPGFRDMGQPAIISQGEGKRPRKSKQIR